MSFLKKGRALEKAEEKWQKEIKEKEEAHERWLKKAHERFLHKEYDV